MAKVVTEMPRAGQGDMAANPIPEPKDMRRSDAAAATKAPAMIAGHEAADLGDRERTPALSSRGSIKFRGP